MKISLPDRSINCKASEGIGIALQEAVSNVNGLDTQMRVLSNYYDPDEKKVVEKDEIVWTRSGTATPEVLAQAKALFGKMPPALDEVSAQIFTIRLKKFYKANLTVEDKRKTEAVLIAEYSDEEAREKASEAEEKRLDEEWEREEAARIKKRQEGEEERERERVREQEERAKEKAAYDEAQRKEHEGKVLINGDQTGFIISDYYVEKGVSPIVCNQRLIKTVKRDRQGEIALRAAAALCPELNGLILTCPDAGIRSWNALLWTSEFHNFVDETGVQRHGLYQVTLSHTGWYVPHANFIDETSVPEPTVKSGSRATVRRNHALGGIEIKFPDKPSESVLTQLRSNGFRWHSLKKHWYAKYTAEREKLLTSLAA
jgi:hypothetical protein